MEEEMQNIQWEQVEESLVATLYDLQSIYARVYFADKGELPEGIARDDLNEGTRLRKGEISERELFLDGLLAVYNGLNYTWSTRCIDLARAEREGGVMFQISTPTEGAFVSLVPALPPERNRSRNLGDKPITLTPVHMALHEALSKLETLCFRVSLLPEVDPAVWIDCPDELAKCDECRPFEEEDLELHLAMVYCRVNEAWNKRFDKTPVSLPGKIRQRRLYPQMILA